MSLADIICNRHFSTNLLTQLNNYLKILLQLFVKTLNQIDSLIVDRVPFYLEEKLIPESIGKLFGELKPLIIQVSLKYLTLYPKLLERGLDKTNNRLGRLVDMGDGYSLLIETLESNFYIIEFVMSHKDPMDSSTLMKIGQNLAIACSGSPSLLDRLVLVLIESDNQSSGYILAQVLAEAPADTKDRVLTEI
jgi:hypothetical protein